MLHPDWLTGAGVGSNDWLTRRSRLWWCFAGCCGAGLVLSRVSHPPPFSVLQPASRSPVSGSSLMRTDAVSRAFPSERRVSILPVSSAERITAKPCATAADVQQPFGPQGQIFYSRVRKHHTVAAAGVMKPIKRRYRC